ncbi:hypothetical protein DALLNEIH_03273 [Bacillus sp. B01(2024)]
MLNLNKPYSKTTLIIISLRNTCSKRVFKIHGSINNIGSIVAIKEKKSLDPYKPRILSFF